MPEKEGLICDICGSDIPSDSAECPVCGFPARATEAEKRAFHVLMLNIKGWIPEAQKAVNSILSFAVIFLMFAAVVAAFSLIFRLNFYRVAFFYILLALVYVALYYLSKKFPYKTVFLAFLVYALHTIYEFSSGMVIPDFSAGKTSRDVFTIMFKYTPFLYIVFRLMLFSAFIRGIYFILKIEKHPKLVRWLKEQGDHSGGGL